MGDKYAQRLDQTIKDEASDKVVALSELFTLDQLEEARARANSLGAARRANGCLKATMFRKRTYRCSGMSQISPRCSSRARRSLRRCLEKNPKQRLRHIGDARELLDIGTRYSGISRWEISSSISYETRSFHARA